MTQAKHTPGPWHTTNQLNPNGNRLITNAHGYIATVPGWEVDAPDEAKANARLIAAAPDMKSELEGFANIFQAFLRKEINKEEAWAELWAHYEKRAAIAKATGKEG